jgi:hypothetical protein
MCPRSIFVKYSFQEDKLTIPELVDVFAAAFEGDEVARIELSGNLTTYGQ